MTESMNSLRQEVAAAAEELKNEAERVRADAHTETEKLRGELYEQRSKHARDLEAQAGSFKGAIAEAVKVRSFFLRLSPAPFSLFLFLFKWRLRALITR